MPFLMIRQDITKMEVDAIVNAANPSLLGGGGVDGAIHRAAGPGLLAECAKLGGCKTGEARITGGHRLPVRHIIHTVGPIWHGGSAGEPILLASCYHTSLQLAKEHNCETVAFPLISAGVYGYPRDEAIRIASDTIRTFLDETDDSMTVSLVLFDRDSVNEGRTRFPALASYIDDRYAEAHTDAPAEMVRRQAVNRAASEKCIQIAESTSDDCTPPAPKAKSHRIRAPKAAAPRENTELMSAMPAPQAPSFSSALSLEERLAAADESFSEMLLRKIDESGMTDAQCYKKANIDRKLFSKIRSDKHYKPSKPTVLAFAIALGLPLDEVRCMLEKAGFALSHASKFDIIVEYYIERGDYDIFAINEALFFFDQTLLGA
ncbi:MAG: O-acetyl-ADP-ribose deacetylase [Clostridia bacterium]|nr:O-acetyl-ADP-ribose deacetylase [Clostridia bacterium]